HLVDWRGLVGHQVPRRCSRGFSRAAATAKDGERVKARESARGSVGRPPGGPARGSEPPGLKCSKSPEPLTRRERLLQRSYRSQLVKGPIRGARTGESSPLYTSVDASRPRTARRYTGGNGGAAGNRTRVRSAYYRRVYRHSPGEPGQDQYRAAGVQFQGVGPRPAASLRRRGPRRPVDVLDAPAVGVTAQQHGLDG